MFEKYSPTQSEVEAIEVTDKLVDTLPKTGSSLQKFGGQVEIFGALNKKTYASPGDYLVKVDGGHFSVPKLIFEKLFIKGPAADELIFEKPPIEVAASTASATAPEVKSEEKKTGELKENQKSTTETNTKTSHKEKEPVVKTEEQLAKEKESK